MKSDTSKELTMNATPTNSMRLSDDQSDLLRAAAVYRWSMQLAPEIEDPGLFASQLEEFAVLAARLDDRVAGA